MVHNVVSEAADSTTQQLLEHKASYSSINALEGHLCLLWGAPAANEPLGFVWLLSKLAL